MDRPKVTPQPIRREVTGEIMYLDSMRSANQSPEPYPESPGIGDMAIQLFEQEADLMRYHGVRPDIMDAYEAHDHLPTSLEASCIAMADELLRLKEPGSTWTFVDVMVEVSPEDLLSRLKDAGLADVFADQDDQLAFESDGSYYPILDIRKRDATLVGVGLRVYGWDDEKYLFTNKPDEAYEFPRDVLVYPHDEKWHRREFEIIFSYNHATGSFSETIALTVGDMSKSSIHRQIFVSEYAETGYEGHAGKSIKATDARVAALADLIAEMVGDDPRSVAQCINQSIQSIYDQTVAAEGTAAIDRLLATTWPAQCHYFLTWPYKGTSLAKLLMSDETVDEAVEAIDAIIEKWNKR